MESFVGHPGTEHVRPFVVVGDGGGTLPGRLPFIGQTEGCGRPPPIRYSSEPPRRFPRGGRCW